MVVSAFSLPAPFRFGIFAFVALYGAATSAHSHPINEPDTSVVLESAEVRGTRAQEQTPMTYTVLPAAVLRRENNARDIPFLLQNVPNAVVASDAGTGMGYTYLRLRGSDQTRINVTLNGVPLNDPESHGVFWVNTPDLTSSLESVQIQRGVGTSTVGTGAFGGSVSLETAAPSGRKQKTFVATGSLPLGYRGSYFWESGWLGGRKNISFNGRLTQQKANGYIDRSGMDLKSAAFSGVYRYGLQLKDQNAQRGGTIRIFYLDGQERTQQAWYGIPEAKYRGDSAGVEAYIARNYMSEEDANNLRSSGNRTYNAYTYANEIDKYRQTHYQVQWNHRVSNRTYLHANLFAVKGRGYFEQFKRGESFADYGLPNPVVGGDTVTTTDLVRRRWLENQLVGSNGQVRQQWGGQELTAGYNAYTYVGDHFGTIPWMGTASGDWATQGPFAGNGAFDEATERRYYSTRSFKWEASAFARLEGNLGGGWHGYTDLQVRSVAYAYEGEGQSGIFNRTFFNPKLGVSRGRLSTGMGYASLAVAHREPIRSDFIDARGGAPLPEQLLNAELGYRVRKSRYFLEVNAYAMEYRNQLVPTGALNDVGAALRVNVPVSWRRGVELDAAWKPTRLWTLGGSFALSDNRIASFTEVLYDYAADPVAEVVRVFERTPIALSPQRVAAMHIDKSLAKGSLRASVRHVGRQFLDNTGALERSLDAYTTLDLRWVRQTGFGEFQLDVINATNAHYAPNGYTWGYLYAGARTTENFVYPMAGVQCMATVRIRLE